MIEYILLPGVDISNVNIREEYRLWLTGWLNKTYEEINQESVASSMCLQGAITEIALYRTIRFDWIGVLEDLLTDEKGRPIAYSKAYSEKLYRFDSQWKQADVHPIYTRFWIERLSSNAPSKTLDWARMIESLIQPSGWIYNPDVSPTLIRTRMKSEYFMSLAMGLEILQISDLLASHRKLLDAALAGAPLTGYLSAEYFRSRSLNILAAPNLAPKKQCEVISACEAGEGYSDFSVASKVDDYMGTAKRTSRDIALHSPIAGLHALALAKHCNNETYMAVIKRLESFYAHLEVSPFDIKAFTIRDIPIPFGTDLSPLELIAASLEIKN